MDEILIEKPEEEPMFFKVSNASENDDSYISWIKSTIGARWVDIVDENINMIRENRDGFIYRYNDITGDWDIDVI